MLKLITLGIFSVSLAAFGRAPATYFQIKTELNRVSQKNLVETLNQFVRESAPSRMVGLPGHDKAKAYLISSIKTFDPRSSGKISESVFKPDVAEAQRFYQNDFDSMVEGKISKIHPDYQKYLRFTTAMKQYAVQYAKNDGVNVIWEKPGLDSSKVLVLTAHYDTISHDPNTMLITEKAKMPGANYNASGVAIALNLIRALAQTDLNYSVQVAFLDWQGIGFLGSFQHAKDLKASGKTIMGVMNLEMLGQDTSFFDKTKKTGNMAVYCRQEDEKVVKIWNNHGQKVDPKVQFEIKPMGFENSDNIRYWEQGLLGATYTQNWQDDFNPKFYQTPQDTPETLNHETLYHAYQYLGGAALGTLLDITK